jgi:hypothetical protein
LCDALFCVNKIVYTTYIDAPQKGVDYFTTHCCKTGCRKESKTDLSLPFRGTGGIKKAPCRNRTL